MISDCGEQAIGPIERTQVQPNSRFSLDRTSTEPITGALDLPKTLSSGTRTNQCSDSLLDIGENVTRPTVGAQPGQTAETFVLIWAVTREEDVQFS